jgi:hypothetical protein
MTLIDVVATAFSFVSIDDLVGLQIELHNFMHSCSRSFNDSRCRAD